MKKRIAFLFLFIFLASCTDESSEIIKPKTSGTLAVTLLNKCSQEPIANAKVRLLGTNLSAFSDSSGYCYFNDMPFSNYTLFVSADGIKSFNKNFDFSNQKETSDTLYLQNEYYPYSIVKFQDMPDFESMDSTYYIESNNEPNWIFSYRNYDTCLANGYIDSLINLMLDNEIQIDTLYFSSYLNHCGPLQVELEQKLVFKLKIKNESILNLGFKHIGQYIHWVNCYYFDEKLVEYRKYYVFN